MMDNTDTWCIDESFQPESTNWTWGNEKESQEPTSHGPGCILYDPHKNVYTSLQPFTRNQKKIEDEIIDMSFLNEYISIQLTEDGGVVKYFPKQLEQKEENTDKNEFVSPEEQNLEPEQFARVRIRYEGRKENGELLDKSRDRKQLKAFKLHGEDMILGVSYATASLKKGETAWFKFLPEYHYGVKGAPPMVPENATLYYKVELTDFTNPKKQLENNDYEGRIKILEESREKGNEAFAAKDFEKALREYKKGTETIKNLPKVLAAVVTDEQKKVLREFQVKLGNNALLMCIKMKQYKEGLQFVEMVLSADPKNPKGIFRKGQCLLELEYLNGAIKAFNECLKVDAESKEECEKMIAECQRRKDKRLKKEKKRFHHVLQNIADVGEKEEMERKLKEKMERKKERENMPQGGLGEMGDIVLKKVKVDQQQEENTNCVEGGLIYGDNVSRE